MNRVLDLYDNQPGDGRVVCVDEFGPLNLQPRAGRGWRPRRRPKRLRATYHRTQGVRHLFGALDLATGQLYYRIGDRKRWREFRAFLQSLRQRWPGEKLYVIVDNFSLHKGAEVRDWCALNDVELVFLPTYSSWLNWIESEFAAQRYFALNGTDHRSHDEQDNAIGGLHPLAQPARRRTQTRLRRQLEDPATGLPTVRCLMSHLDRTRMLNISFDLLYFGPQPYEPDSPIATGIVEPGMSYCMYGYIVARNALDSLLAARLETAIVPADEFMLALYSDHPRADLRAHFPQQLAAVALDPPLVTHYNTGSDTEDTEFIEGDLPSFESAESRVVNIRHYQCAGVLAFCDRPICVSANSVAWC